MNNGLAAGLKRSHWDLLVPFLWPDIIIILLLWWATTGVGGDNEVEWLNGKKRLLSPCQLMFFVALIESSLVSSSLKAPIWPELMRRAAKLFAVLSSSSSLMEDEKKSF